MAFILFGQPPTYPNEDKEVSMATPQLESFEDRVKSQIKDEIAASEEYRDMMEEARALGLHGMAAKLKAISDDEASHRVHLEIMVIRLDELQEHPEREDLGPIPIPTQTVGDWANLAGDIKDKTDDPALRAAVNTSLDQIYTGGPEAEDAKCWMVKTAGELGIG